MLRNSESSSSCAMPTMARGSKAMPQMGQAPGLSLLICWMHRTGVFHGFRLQRHATLWASSRLTLTDFRVHGADIRHGADVCWRQLAAGFLLPYSKARLALAGADSCIIEPDRRRAPVREPRRFSQVFFLEFFFDNAGCRSKSVALIFGLAASFFRVHPHAADNDPALLPRSRIVVAAIRFFCMPAGITIRRGLELLLASATAKEDISGHHARAALRLWPDQPACCIQRL